VPGGSDYRGPHNSLERYAAVVKKAGDSVKGAKSPYTSRGGHMFSFLDEGGTVALHLSPEVADEFLGTYDSGPVEQYGRVMRGYVSVPDDLVSRTEELSSWFARAYEWVGTLEPKPTRKKGR
jgi:hypothetical protein